MTYRLIGSVVLGVFLGGCVAVERTPDATDDSDFVTADFAKAWARAERQNADPATRDYLATPNFLQSPLNKAVGECITNVFPAIETAAVVFRIDFSGTTVDSVSDQSGYVAECIPRKVHGMRVPPPPSPGFLVCGRYTRLSDSEYALESCGPGHLKHVCKRVGTTTSCRSQRID